MLLLLQARFSDKIPESWNGMKLGFLSYSTIEDGLEDSESLFDCFFDWNCGLVEVKGVFGLVQIIGPAHPQMAGFLLTLATTMVIQITWPRLPKNEFMVMVNHGTLPHAGRRHGCCL
jgi:hypothetical protein